MTQCWSEGTLRAYLDRELPPEQIGQVAAHLKECVSCDERCRELSAKAAQVAALIDLLPELEVETLHVPLRIPGRVSSRPRVGWVGAAVALAAGLGIAAYMIPQRQAGPVVTAVAPPVVLAPAAPAAPQTVAVVAAPAGERKLAVRPARRVARPAIRPVASAGDFVALDDEPFESGVIMRVAVTPGKTQADIVFGPDGRARAFRLVRANGQKF
uniref:Putative transmembrane anti-sigma factor n=1 Tax=Solibacter usitatus (strain Ellin6076) TaxID=234267 RepID=Q01UI5_SOLUE